MAKVLMEKYSCECGVEFEWKTFFLESGEYFPIPWDVTKSNVKHKNEDEYGYHVTIQCPICNKRYFATKER